MKEIMKSDHWENIKANNMEKIQKIQDELSI